MKVVITGTTVGLGLQMRDLFRFEGHMVIGSHMPGHSTDWPNEFPLDIRDPSSIDTFARQIYHVMDGKFDVLINNAGINGICHFQDLTPEFIDNIMNTNFRGPVLLTQALLQMLENGGKVVNIVSDAAWRPMRHSLAYNCSKAALDMATKQMARELTKPHNISVFGIRPGRMCDTAMSEYIDAQVASMRDWTPDQVHAYFVQNSVTGVEAWPRNVARLIYDIVNNPLSGNLSGACLDLVG